MATNPANDILIRAVMSATSGLPADAVINDFAFHYGSGMTDAKATEWAGEVDNFYNVTQASTHKLGAFISGAISRAVTHELQVYRIAADGSIGSPVLVIPWLGPVASSTSSGLPTEVAGVLSFQADQTGVMEEVGTTRPKARRRGRVFIGPLNQDALDATTPPYMLSSIFRTTLAQAAVALADGAPSGNWAVWSRADAILRPVLDGWVDNAPDTQRRRGPGATLRAAWSG